MPITAKLSRKFYETFGDDIANELVGWFNSVDAQYRLDLRDMLDQRFATQDARIDQRLATLDAKLEQRLAVLEARVGARFESFEGKLTGRFETRLADVRTEMQRWMLASWSSMMLVLLGTLFAVLKTR